MKELVLTTGHVCFIDDVDYPMVSTSKWYGHTVGNNIYVLNTNSKFKPSRMLHRVLTGAKKGEYVDHKNGNSLDNRRENLRICTASQNAANHSGSPDRRKSQYKGVRKNKNCATWQARIRVNNKEMYLGNFCDEMSAAIAYNDAAVKHFGNFAKLNKVK